MNGTRCITIFLCFFFGGLALLFWPSRAAAQKWLRETQISSADYWSYYHSYPQLPLLQELPTTANPSPLTEDQIVGNPHHTPVLFFRVGDYVLGTWNTVPPSPHEAVHAIGRIWDGNSWGTAVQIDNGGGTVNLPHFSGQITFYAIPRETGVIAAWELLPGTSDGALHAFARIWRPASWEPWARTDNGNDTIHEPHYAGGMTYYELPVGNWIMANWNILPGGNEFVQFHSVTKFWKGQRWELTSAITPQMPPAGMQFTGEIYFRKDYAADSVYAIYKLASANETKYYKRTLILPPAVPSLLAPADSSIIFAMPVEFDWTDSRGAEYYRMQISASKNFKTILFDTSVSVSKVSLHRQLAPGWYYWRATAGNSVGWLAWSPPWHFYIPSENQPPVANADGPYVAAMGEVVVFDGSASYDPDSDSLTYLWDFGDGTTDTGLQPHHAYSDTGRFVVMLSVDDGRGGVASDSTLALIHPPGSREIFPDSHTVILDHFNGTCRADNIYPPSALVFTQSMPGLGEAAAFSGNCTIRYDASSWYLGNQNARGAIEALVKLADASVHDLVIFQWYQENTPPASGWIGRLRVLDRKLNWWVWGSGTPIEELTGRTLLPIDEWIHVAVTWGPQGTRLFVNGILDSAVTYNLCPNMLSDVHVFIGGSFGCIDELHISSVQRSDAEIRSHFGLITPVRRRESENIPSSFALEQNYPNPFNPTTAIGFSLPQKAHVELCVFDRTGRKIATLLRQTLPAGKHVVRFDGSRLPSGVYFYRMRLKNGRVWTRKMVLLR